MNDAEAGTFIAREQRRFERGLCLLLDQGSFPMKAFPAFPVVRVMSLRSLRTCLIARDRDVRRVDLCEIELVSLDSRLRLRSILTFLTPRSSEGRSLPFWCSFSASVFLQQQGCTRGP